MAKLIPFTVVCEVGAATMVLMPITWPPLSIKGPPESPELIGASVWSRLLSLQLVPKPVSAMDVRPVAEIIPVVTLGPPSRPRA